MHQGMWHVLCEVQVCATRDFREQRSLWKMLHTDDHPWKQDQVPLGCIASLPLEYATVHVKYLMVDWAICCLSFRILCNFQLQHRWVGLMGFLIMCFDSLALFLIKSIIIASLFFFNYNPKVKSKIYQIYSDIFIIKLD